MKLSVRSKRPLKVALQVLLRKNIVRYIVVGGLVYLFELWVIIAAQRYGATATEAVALSFTLGLIASFFLQKLVTFGDRRMHHKVVLHQAIAVGALVVWNLAFTVLLTRLLTPWLPPTVTRTIALLITTIWNFYLYKTRIFAVLPPKAVAVERPSFLLGKASARLQRTTEPEVSVPPLPIASKHRSFVIVSLCLGLVVALISAATILQAIEAKTKVQTNTTNTAINDTACSGETILQVVAHQDDDLIFMNPDLQRAIDAGKCVRTVYLTAGNAGQGLSYAKQREKGAEAAYSVILQQTDQKWRTHYVRVGTKSTVEIAVPATDTRVSLIFYRLPDGAPTGVGYGPEGEPPRSLAGLLNGVKESLTTVDARAVYTQNTLVASLATLIARYKPTDIRLMGVLPDERSVDHSDHYASGWIARLALARYTAKNPDAKVTVSYYMGYPVIYRDENVTGADLTTKETAFLAYAKFDDSVCQDAEDCSYGQNAYVKYLPRMYTIPESNVYSWGN